MFLLQEDDLLNNCRIKKCVFIGSTILSALVYLITILQSPINGNIDSQLTFVIVMLSIITIFNFIATISGIILVRRYLNKVLTVRNIILIVLLIMNILLFLNGIYTLYCFMAFLS